MLRIFLSFNFWLADILFDTAVYIPLPPIRSVSVIAKTRTAARLRGARSLTLLRKRALAKVSPKQVEEYGRHSLMLLVYCESTQVDGCVYTDSILSVYGFGMYSVSFARLLTI